MKFDLKLLPKRQRISLPDLQMDRSWDEEQKKSLLALRQAELNVLKRQLVPRLGVVEWQRLKPLLGEELREEGRTLTNDTDELMKSGAQTRQIRQTGRVLTSETSRGCSERTMSTT